MDGDILSYGHGIQVGFGVLAYGHGVVHMGSVVVIVIAGCTAVTNGEVMGSYSFQLGYVDGIGVFGTGSQACDLTGHFKTTIMRINTIRVTPYNGLDPSGSPMDTAPYVDFHTGSVSVDLARYPISPAAVLA